MISVILVEPENPGNTGAICRSMKNFGFEDLIILGPKFDISDPELKHRAKWANDIIEKAKVLEYNQKNLKKIRKDFDYLVSTTARIGRDYNVLRSPITPKQLAEKIAELDLKRKKVGIMIGREGSGLSNEEIAFSDFNVTIPTSKKYATMNMAHSTTIILYEIFQHINSENITSHITPISEKEREQLMKLFEEKLKTMSFATEEKKNTQRIVWKKVISRSFLSKREAYAMMGFLRKIR